MTNNSNETSRLQIIENPVLEAHEKYLKDGVDYRPTLRSCAQESGERVRESIRERARANLKQRADRML